MLQVSMLIAFDVAIEHVHISAWICLQMSGDNCAKKLRAKSTAISLERAGIAVTPS